MKKIITIILFIILVIPFNNVYAVPGCCSWHGGEVGCSGGRTLCSDGTVSSCPCDGTSSSTNYGSSASYNRSYNNDSDENTLLYYIMAILVGSGVVLVFGSLINAFDKSSKKRQAASSERYRLKQEEEEKRVENGKDAVLDHIIINNDYMIESYVKNIDGSILNKFESDDLWKLLDSNNVNIFNLFDVIYENEYGRKSDHILVFNRFVEKILYSKKINTFKNKCVKYLIKNSYINNYDKIFSLSLEYKHIEIIKYILNNCNEHDFRLEGSKMFEYLVEINDLQLIEKISKKSNFYINFDAKVLFYSKNTNIENEYKILNMLAKNKNCSNLYIDQFIDKTIDFNDNDSILIKTEHFSKMDGFLEENGYYVVFQLIKKQNDECIKTILNKYNNIDLNKVIIVDDKRYNGLTLLTYACYRKSLKTVELLLDYGADYNLTDKYGNSALAYACDAKSLKIVKLLYEKGCKLEDDYYNESIERAIKKKDSFYLPQIYISKI